jgi:hypothetical protein
MQGVGWGEVGAVEKIGPRYYLMIGVKGGRMLTLVADRPDGPFPPAKKNTCLLVGHTYFTRFCRTPDELLVTHHSIARGGSDRTGNVFLGLLKSAVVDGEGTLRLGWWKGNEKHKDDATVVTLSKPTAKPGSTIAMLGEVLNADAGVILEGRLTLPVSKDDAPAGLFISCGQDHGSAILTRAGGRCELGEIKADGSGWKAEYVVDREMDFGRTPAFRLVLKKCLLEFYLNDIMIDCYSLPAAATGRIGLLGDLFDLKAWCCNKPATPANQRNTDNGKSSGQRRSP